MLQLQADWTHGKFHFISEYQLFAYEIDLHILVLNSPETALSLVKPAAVVTAAVLLATT
jgi:hypothetical protein